MKHKNNGKCPACQEHFNKYPNFEYNLRTWFENFQAIHPEAHISEAGRGKEKQEQMLAEKKSRAQFGESAHNYNAAIDVFVQLTGRYIYDDYWFQNVLAPAIPSWLVWYGAPGSKFHELPHIQIKDWKELVAKDLLWLVEEAE